MKLSWLIKYTLIIICGFVLASCKSSKPIVSSNIANPNVSAKQLIKTYNNKLTDFKTLSGRVSIDYNKNGKSRSVSVNLRMEKDKTIWMSAFLGIGKVLITPTRVAFYDKWNSRYFDGDFSYLSKLLGTEIDFYKLQNILMGQAIYDLNKKPHKISVFENSYLLVPKKQDNLFDLEYKINPSYFKLDALEVTQKKEQRNLEVQYNSYQSVDNLTLPKLINIIANDSDDNITIDLELKSIRLNEALRFPFKIPSGYKEISIK